MESSFNFRLALLNHSLSARFLSDDGITEHITLQKMSSMRTALNSTAMDIMYYQSPLYRKEVCLAYF